MQHRPRFVIQIPQLASGPITEMPCRLGACTSKARQLDESVRCLIHVGPSPELTVPLYPDAGLGLTKVPPEEEFDGTTDR